MTVSGTRPLSEPAAALVLAAAMIAGPGVTSAFAQNEPVYPVYDGFTVTEDRAKLKNLRRDPRCTLLVSRESWWGFVVLQGKARIMSADNTDAEEFRLAMRDAYRTCSGSEHPNWDEYDQAMRDDRRSIIVVVPEHIYGTAM